jgi:hypothetical protein
MFIYFLVKTLQFPRKMSTIQNVYLDGPLFTSYTDKEFELYGPKHLRQVSQITYYGPYGKRSIYIDYDEQWDNIFIFDDKIYSVNGGNVLIINEGCASIKIYDISIKDIIEHIIKGYFDVYVTWSENGRADSALNERVFQAPLSQIDIYWVPWIPCIPCIPEESVGDTLIEEDYFDNHDYQDNCCANCDKNRESPYLEDEDYEYFEYSANY